MTIDTFEYLLDAIYGAGEDPTQWGSVLAALVRELPGAGAVFHAGRRDGAGFSFGTSCRHDPEAGAAYAEYYFSVNPLNAALAAVPAGVAVPDHRLVARAEVENTEFYNDFARRFDIAGSITLMLTRNKEYEACLGIVGRFGSDIFTDEQVSFVQRFAPHILRAVALNRRLAELKYERTKFENALDSMTAAVLLLDGKGAIHYCNSAGQQLLRKRDGLTVLRGRLTALDACAQTRLAELIRAAMAARGARGGSVSLPRQPPAHPLHLRVMPFGRKSDFWLSGDEVGAIVFISDPDAAAGDAADEVMDAYRLTPAEKNLLRELLAGHSLQEGADALNITRATSRNRLAQIMSKTDTQRQAQLLQLILRSTVPVR
jgi:DNA-binding CsgD family transcriptional regulator/PAS domain-containing protein